MDKQILAPGIVLYKTNPGTLLDLVKSSLEGRWNIAKGVNTTTHQDEINSARQCYDYAISNDALYGQDETLKALYRETDSWIADKISDYVNHYSIEKVVEGPYIYLKYENSNKFDFHIDDGKKFPRTVSVSAYLNNDYEGGLIEFNHFGISHKPEIGDIVVFSASYPYMHRVTPVTSGVRYAVVNWYRYQGYPAVME